MKVPKSIRIEESIAKLAEKRGRELERSLGWMCEKALIQYLGIVIQEKKDDPESHAVDRK